MKRIWMAGLICLLSWLGAGVSGWGGQAAALTANTYYVSSSAGNDANDGLSEGTPLRSIARVNGLTLHPGDRVLFKCGDVWRGEMLTIRHSGTAAQPITFGSYPAGCVNQPLLSGTQPVSGWVALGGNLYRADLAAGANAGRFPYGVNQLFRNGQRLTLGRWPNLDAGDGGYATLEGQPSGTQVTDAQLPAGNWSGAVLHIKSIRWAILNRQVTASSGTTLTLGSPVSCWGGSCAGWGYFLNNHPNTLDRDGEWALSGNGLYLYSTSGAPLDGEVEASVVLFGDGQAQRSWGGVNLGADYGSPIAYVTVENLALSGWFRHGIATPTNMHPSEPHDLILRNNTIRDVDGTGINLETWVWDAQDGRPDGWRGGYALTVSGNRVERANHMGINLYSRSSTFERNTLLDIARIENLGARGMGCDYDQGDASGGICTEDGDGIRIKAGNAADSGNSNTLRGNRLERIGYNGFDVFGYGNFFEGNVILQACISKGDCGAVRTFGNGSLSSTPVHDLVFQNNILVDTIGNTDGCRSDFDALFGFGFYVDYFSRDIVLNGNTVAHSTAHGVLFQDSTGVLVGNTLYNNGDTDDYSAAQLFVGSAPAYVGSSTDNIFFGLNPHARTLALNELSRLGSSDNNRYFHPYRANHIYAGSEYNLATWRSVSGKDTHSVEHWYTQPIGQTPRSHLFYNDTAQTQIVNLGAIYYLDLNQTPVYGTLSLAPYTSRILVENGTVTDLAVQMAVMGPLQTEPGATVTYTMTLENRGSVAASQVILENIVPAQIVNLSWSADSGAVALQPGTRYIWSLASLPAGGRVVWTVTGEYAADLIAGTPLLLEATVSSETPDGNPGNNVSRVWLGDWQRLYLPAIER